MVKFVPSPSSHDREKNEAGTVGQIREHDEHAAGQSPEPASQHGLQHDVPEPAQHEHRCPPDADPEEADDARAGTESSSHEPRIIKEFIMEEILDEIIEKFDFKYFCVNCLSCNDLCVFPYYCSRSYPIIASSSGAASSGPTNDSTISLDVTVKQSTINLRNKNEIYKNKLKETHKNSPEFVKNFNVLSNFTDKKEDNSLKLITDPNFTNIEASDICIILYYIIILYFKFTVI